MTLNTTILAAVYKIFKSQVIPALVLEKPLMILETFL